MTSRHAPDPVSAIAARPAPSFPPVPPPARAPDSPRVEVRIGAVEVRAPAPEPPVEPQATVTPDGGFDGYAALRSYRL